MTAANQVTIARLLLIPVFVALALAYVRSAEAGVPEPWLRAGAAAVFAVAALSDALDGWMARRFRQESDLGRLLDPLADKLLVVSVLVLLTVGRWPTPLPLWFMLVIAARELLVGAGTAVLKRLTGRAAIGAHWSGKLATVLQFMAIGAALLGWAPPIGGLAAAAAVASVGSGVFYLIRAMRLPEPTPGR